MKRKVWGAALTLCMLLTLFTTTAFAADTTVASYNGTEYTSWSALADAVNELTFDEASNTLTLTNDAEMSAAFLIYSDVTLDLGGNTLSGASEDYSAILVYGGDVTVTNGTISSCFRGIQVTSTSDSNVTVSDVTIVAGDIGVAAWSGSVTISDSTITCTSTTGSAHYGVYLQAADGDVSDSTVTGGTGIVLFGNSSEDAAELTVSNSIVTGTESFGISTNGRTDCGNCSITVNDSSVEGEAAGMYLPAVDSATEINGDSTSITGTNAGIEIRAGELTVNGGTITATSETAAYIANDNGTTVSGAAIAVSQHSTDQEITVTINGGELEGYFGVLELNTYASQNSSDVTVTIGGDAVVTATGTYDAEAEVEAGMTKITSDGSAVYSMSASEGGETSDASEYTTVTITGGTYNTDESEYLDTSVTTLATYTDGDTTYYGYYADVDSALAASPAGATVTALEDVDADTEETVTYEVIRAATCTTTGITKVTTSTPAEEEGGEPTVTTKYVSIPATGHSYKTYTWTWAEDYATATVASTCTKCGEELTVDAAEVTSETTEATCSAEGETVYTATATVNGETVTGTATVVLDKTEHTAGEVEYTGSCTQGTAVATVKCTECGEVISTTEDTDKYDAHSYVYDDDDVSWTLVPDGEGGVASCTVTVVAHCERCAKTNSINADIEATFEVTQEATCTETGLVTVSATLKNLSWSDESYKTLTAELEIPMLSESGEHVYEEILVEETCTEGAYLTKVCIICGEEDPDAEREYVEGSEALGHDEVDVVVDATCTENAKIVTTCDRCGAELGETDLYDLTGDDQYAAFGHEYEAVVTEPTCSEGGYTTYTCANCGDSYVADETEADADAHDWELVSTLREASCETETNGIGKYTCSFCGATKYAVISAEHDWQLVEGSSTATCTEDGEANYVCSVCYAETTMEVAASGHDYVEVIDAEPTCGEAGSAHEYCVNCGDETDSYEIPATGEHDYVDGELVDATCTEAAYVTRVCSICGQDDPDAEKQYVEGSEPTGHTEEYSVTDATCTENAKAVTTCSVCGEVLEEVDLYEELGLEEYAATGHDYQAVVTEPTCSAGGYTTWTCSYCGDSYVTDETEAVADAHNYELTATLKEADCSTETNGIGKYTCSECGATKYQVIPYEHDLYEVEDSSTATCTEAGTVEYICNVCGETMYEDVEATGHKYDDGVVTTEATCGEDGVMTYTCTVCGDTYTETIPATGEHDYGEDELAEDDVTIIKVCTVCGDVQVVGHIEGAHTYDEGVVATEATCTEDGVMTYTCTVCGESYTEAIPATGHTAGEAVIENEVAATCTEDGSYDSVIYCTVCGAEISRETITVAATGHTTEVQNAKDATCTEDGYTGDTVCTVCGEIIEAGEAIPATGHTTEVQNAKDATCTEDGYTGDTVCTVCGETVEAGEAIPATGHTAGEAVIENEVAATCTEDGSYDSVVYCTVCKAEISRETVTVAATGHSYDEGEVTTAATCTEDGVKTFTCANCGESYTEAIPATGHTEGEAVIENEVAATCTTEGSYDSVVYCETCGAELSRETITVEATGHSFDAESIEWTWDTDEQGNVIATAAVICTACDVSEELTADVTSATTEATCGTDGKTVYTATVTIDGEEYTDEMEVTIPATGVHTYYGSYDLYDNDPTSEHYGEYYEVCEVCGGGERVYEPIA